MFLDRNFKNKPNFNRKPAISGHWPIVRKDWSNYSTRKIDKRKKTVIVKSIRSSLRSESQTQFKTRKSIFPQVLSWNFQRYPIKMHWIHAQPSRGIVAKITEFICARNVRSTQSHGLYVNGLTVSHGRANRFIERTSVFAAL